MILSFSTQLDGKPTYFPEKIITGLYLEKMISKDKARELFYPNALLKIIPAEYHGVKGYVSIPIVKFDNSIDHQPKIHTIREDKTERWKPGIMIDFFINARQVTMFRFAPRIPVISVQEIFMTSRGSMLEITVAKQGSYIGGEDFYVDAVTQGQLATNDGFSKYDDFRNYFLSVIEANGKATGNYWFSGKIIHWTNFNY